MAREQEILFQTYQGVTYQLQWTADFITWTDFRQPIQGDGTTKSVIVLPQEEAQAAKDFRVKQTFSSMEPLHLRATTSWDGSSVLLEWNEIQGATDPNARYHLIRNGGTPGIPLPLSTTSYRDTSVQSGQTYTYTLPIYAS